MSLEGGGEGTGCRGQGQRPSPENQGGEEKEGEMWATPGPKVLESLKPPPDCCSQTAAAYIIHCVCLSIVQTTVFLGHFVLSW